MYMCAYMCTYTCRYVSRLGFCLVVVGMRRCLKGCMLKMLCVISTNVQKPAP